MVTGKSRLPTLVLLPFIGLDNMKYFTLYILGILVISLCIPVYVFAAQMRISPSHLSPALHAPFDFVVEFLPEQNSINTIEGTLIIPQGLTIKTINDADSIIPLWIERPELKNNQIHFAGVIPGGFQSEQGIIFKITAEAVTNIQEKIELKDVQALQNDGQGTPVIVTVSPAQVSSISGESQSAPIVEDTILPERFTPIVSQDPNLYEGKWFVVFSTTDKQSGINHYEVKESKKGTWIKTSSPYLLADQTRSSPISIKAVDNAGNERIEVVPELYPHHVFKQMLIWGILILLICASIIYWFR